MTDYTKVNNFTAKDDLPSGDSEKDVLGADWDDEFAAIATAILSKYESADLASAAEAAAGVASTLMTPLRMTQVEYRSSWLQVQADATTNSRLSASTPLTSTSAVGDLSDYANFLTLFNDVSLSAAGTYVIDVLLALSGEGYVRMGFPFSVTPTYFFSLFSGAIGTTNAAQKNFTLNTDASGGLNSTANAALNLRVQAVAVVPSACSFDFRVLAYTGSGFAVPSASINTTLRVRRIV